MDLFGGGQMFSAVLDAGMDVWKQDKAEGMQDHAQHFAQDQQLQAQAFGERMSNTAWQRAMADMRSAGVNPMLAASRGGADTPHSPGIGGPGGQAPSLRSNFSGSLVNAAQVRNIEAQTDNIDADTELKKSHTTESGLRSGHLIEELKKWEDVLVKIKNEAYSSRESLAQQIIETLRQSELWKGQFPDVQSVVQHVKKLAAEAKLAELEIPRAVNEAVAEETAFKRYVSPFIKDAGNLAGTAASSAFGLRALRGKPMFGVQRGRR